MSDIVFDNLVFDRLREIGDQRDRIAALEDEITRLRLTDAERVSVKWAAEMIDDSGEYKWHAATLRVLLERTK
jgi:hypothetical protein